MCVHRYIYKYSRQMCLGVYCLLGSLLRALNFISTELLKQPYEISVVIGFHFRGEEQAS